MELRKALEILLRHVLCVLDDETLVVIAVRFFDISENIEDHRDRAIANSVNS